eukprot:1828608-Pyramimonas_sp.AAC.1
MEDLLFSTCGSRLSAAHIRFKRPQQFNGWRASPTVPRSRMVEVLGTVFWHESGATGRNPQVDPRR